MTKTLDHSWYFTAPWDPISVRRGDPLGLRAGADYFADRLAPGLSNASSDARWISLLSWCLQWSHIAWTRSGGGDLSRRDAQLARYAWLRPLELLWVDRTLESGQTTGQLRGRRSVERWRDAGRRPPDFAMSPDQFRRYRQIGTYGAYRVVLRNAPGLTTGDGWTPRATAIELANLMNDGLPSDVKLRLKDFGDGTRWRHWADGNEARYWVEHGWQMATAEACDGFLPTPRNAVEKRLPIEERRLLKPALFHDASSRRVTAEILASAKTARSHTDLCAALADSNEIKKLIEPAAAALLPAYFHLADTAMHAMRELWKRIIRDKATQTPSSKKLSGCPELQSGLDCLRNASMAWLREPGRSMFRHDQVVTSLAEGMQNAARPLDQLRALARHHEQHGGGRRWFHEQSGVFIPLLADAGPLLADTGIAASNYRFRLRSLSRLAAQCGVADMRVALDAVERSKFDPVSGPPPDEEDEGEAL